MKQRLPSSSIQQKLLFVLTILSSSLLITLNAFTPTPTLSNNRYKIWNNNHQINKSNNNHHDNHNSIFQLHLSSKSEEDVSKLRAGELRKELQSYGISTKSFFEKSELVDAVKKARAEGKKPIDNNQSSGTGSTGASGSTSTGPKTSSDSSKSTDSSSRDEKLAKEMEKCKSMKVGELKKELESYGISTKSFFEKSEFVRALAEARVDGVKKGAGAGNRRAASREEEYDPSYRDVQVMKMDARMLGMDPVIDVRLG